VFIYFGRAAKKIMELAGRQGFKDAKRKGWAKPMLRFDNNALNTVRLDSEDVFRRPMLKELYKAHQNTEFPTKLGTRRSEPLLNEAKQQDFEIFVWQLGSTNVQMMRPKKQ
jgi:hypothetical protein